MKRILQIIDSLNDRTGKIAGLLFIPLIGIILYEVVMRYIFNKPTIWAHESSVYIFGAMWVLVGGATLLNGRMVNMDIFYIRLSQKNKAILDICTALFSVSFTAVLLWKSWGLFWNSFLWNEHSESVWRVPFYPIRFLLPLGALLLLLQLISKLVKDFYSATGRNLK